MTTTRSSPSSPRPTSSWRSGPWSGCPRESSPSRPDGARSTWSRTLWRPTRPSNPSSSDSPTDSTKFSDWLTATDGSTSRSDARSRGSRIATAMAWPIASRQSATAGRSTATTTSTPSARKFDRDGNLWVALCLTGSFTSENKFRGWALRISPDGKVTPTCSGLRSPGGLGMNAEGDVFYTENQGPWNAHVPWKHLRPRLIPGATPRATSGTARPPTSANAPSTPGAGAG